MLQNILQPTHLILLLAIVLLAVGTKRLPETARSLGRSIREFREGIRGERHEPEPVAPPSAPPVGDRQQEGQVGAGRRDG